MVNNQKVEVCYNVQTTVEEKNKLILDFEVTNAVKDKDQLSKMSKRAKDILEVETLEALADKGYHKATEIKECVENGITPYVPKPENPNKMEFKEFETANFNYDKENDYYNCPNGIRLEFKSAHKKENKIFKRYHNYEECKQCELKNKFTKSKTKGRVIDRWKHQEIIDNVEIQTKENWDKYQKRQWLSEHPFGTIKRSLGAYYVLTKGIESVGAEIELVCLVYNLKRVINILGAKNVIRKLATK